VTAEISKDTVDRFRARFVRVLAHVDEHLDEPLSLERLSDIAAFSKFHFQRQFTELFGLGVYQYVQQLRLHRAGHWLAYRKQVPITTIAHDSGYDSAESFARAFRKKLGQSPSEFREEPDWETWHAIQRQLSELRNRHMKPSHTAQDVRILEFKPIRVATLEHRGDPKLLGESIRRFIEWRKQNRLPPRISSTFNIVYDDPETTEPAAFRFDLCAATDQEIEPNTHGVIGKLIPGGRCATLRHTGSDATLGQTLHFLYGIWLPLSGEEPRDFPLFMQRVAFFPDVPEHQSITDVYLPLK
jgi:AraC family transcriptional regulator